MYTRSQTEPVRLAHVTAESVSSDAVQRRLGLRPEVATVVADTDPSTAATVFADAAVDCVVVDSTVDGRQRESVVEEATEAGVAVLVFAPDATPTTLGSLVATDNTEVVQSSVTAAPQALVRRRLESVCERPDDEVGERALTERIFDTSPAGIVVMDPDGTIQRANEKAAEILGSSVDAVVGSKYAPDDIVVRTRDGTELDTDQFPVSQIRQTGEPVRNLEYILDQPSGETFITVDGVPLFGDDQLRRVVIAFDDVTDQVERERKLAQQRNEFAQLDQINRTLRGVGEALLAAETQAEVIQAVCDRLSASGQYRYAVGLQPAEEGRLVAQAWPDFAAEFVDSAFPVENATPETSLCLRAISTGAVQVIQDIGSPGSEDRVPGGDSTEGASPEPETPGCAVDAAAAEEFDCSTVACQAAVEEAGVESVAAIPVVYEETTYSVITVFAPHRRGFSEREVEVLEELGRYVSDAIAAAESRNREQTLTSLYKTTQDLLAANTKAAVSDVVVQAGAEVLDLSGVGVFLFDDEENVLQPAAATDELLGFFSETRTFGPGDQDSLTWKTYATGEPRWFRDVRESEQIANPNTDARSSVLLPLGDHGVFVVASREIGALDERLRRLIGLLATTTEAALDRVAGQAGIRERDRELAERTARLEQLEAALSLGREVHAELRDARTRRDVERCICNCVVDLGSCTFAWIGTASPDSEQVQPQSWAGTETEYLDSVSLAMGGDEPGARTATTGEPTIVDNVTAHLRDQEWARTAADSEYESVCAVPIASGATTYGTLVAYATEPDEFGDVLRPTLVELGRIAADRISVIETERGLLTDQLAELEIRVTSDETLLNAVASIVGEAVSYRDLVPVGGTLTQVRFSAPEAYADDILALEDEFVSIESLTQTEHGDGLFRVTLSCEPTLSTLLECGSIPREVTAGPDGTTATVRVPQEIGVRVFLDRVRETFPDAELLTRRSIEDTTHGEKIHAAFEEDLTDRQREVLVTAYESGFFQSPRETTGAELATMLDISQPTVTHHLREAQHRLFGTLFEE